MASNVFEQAAEDVAGVLLGELRDLVVGVSEDVKPDGMAREVAGFIVEGARTGNRAMLDEAKANVPWLLQNHRLRLANASNASNATIAKIFGVVGDTAFAVIGRLLPLLPPV